MGSLLYLLGMHDTVHHFESHNQINTKHRMPKHMEELAGPFFLGKLVFYSTHANQGIRRYLDVLLSKYDQDGCVCPRSGTGLVLLWCQSLLVKSLPCCILSTWKLLLNYCFNGILTSCFMTIVMYFGTGWCFDMLLTMEYFIMLDYEHVFLLLLHFMFLNIYT